MPVDLAIVGLGCVLPGAPDVPAWLARGRAGTPALSALPPHRWPGVGAVPVGGRLAEPDRLTTAVVGLVADPAPGEEPVAALLRTVAREALADGASLAADRADLILANLSLPSTAAVRAAAGPWRDALRENGLPADFGAWAAGGHAAHRFQSGLPARVVAAELGFHGASFALDAACASGLYAVRLAADRLARGQADVVLAAGVQQADLAFLLLGFSQLRALSTSGVPRPLDARADGLIVGEGAAAVLIKRLDDARRDGDRIHAVLRGGGLGNDGRSGNLLAPRAKGQLRTLTTAYQFAGVDPSTVGYVECHATGTRLGDHTELEALAALMPGGTLLSSTKGVIGHTITVAGLAGLVRAVGAVRDGWVPASPWCESPSLPAGFRVPTSPEPWTSPLRRAGVSAFGFGGTNAHLIVEAAETEPTLAPRSARPVAPPPAFTPLAVVGLAGRVGDHVEVGALADALRGEEPVSSRVSGVASWPLRWRIPPNEIHDILPQQLLALAACEAALADAPDLDRDRVGVLIGMGIDLHVGAHSLRPAVPAAASALSAARVQGVLPNFVANRVSALFGLEGPSTTLSAEGLSAVAALVVAEAWLANGTVDAAVVGAVDLPAHPGALAAAAAVDPQRARPAEGAAILVLRRLADAEAAGERVLAVITEARLSGRPLPTPPVPPVDTGRRRARLGHGEAADAGLDLLCAVFAICEGAPEAWVSSTDLGKGHAQVRLIAPPAALARQPHTPALPAEGPQVWVPHPRPTGLPAWNAPFDVDHAPLPVPGAARPVWHAFASSQLTALEPLVWPYHRAGPPPPSVSPPPTLSPPPSGSPPAPVSRHSPQLAAALVELGALAQATARKHNAIAEVHARFLKDRAAALVALADSIGQLEASLRGLPAESVPAPAPAPAGPYMDLDALRRFAAGALSDALGATYADLDAVRPRVRLPLDPLLLVSRVVEVEGERGQLGRSRIVTEYDLPTDAPWAHDGRPPPCVVVESGQADLLLVSILGIDGITQGRSLYRLLDCDLFFHGDRPLVGETLRHDIRIKSFARLGATTLFYFEYDGIEVASSRPVITMRNGCAGFFTPAELARPMGCDTAPSPPSALAAPFSPPRRPAAAEVSAAALDALRATPHALRLPPRPWGLLDRAHGLSVEGGFYGLGGLVAEQDLADDDWFNACHFLDDPCMPGTLMLDGCFQALHLWMLAAGLGERAGADARFEPLSDTPMRLRCRGQVAPGHKQVRYEVRVKAAGLSPRPWALADVILHVDGTPVVRAEDVGARVAGAQRAHRSVGPAHFAEHAVGAHARAFGPAAARFDAGARGPRIPGLPLQLLSRAERIDAEPGSLKAEDHALVAWDVPPAHWLFQASPSTGLPVVGLMEAALQPCGWLTAWGGVALKSPGELFFRNLGGTLTLHRPVWPGVGTLRTHTRVKSVSASAGMTLTFFEMDVTDAAGPVMSGDTHFGYFTPAALAGQRGLPLADAHPVPPTTVSGEAADLHKHPALPRHDLRMLDRLLHADPTGGAAGLGLYAAALDVDPDAWFFTAHFHEDPVMPGSLGIEALAQLARVAYHTAPPPGAHEGGHLAALLPGRPLSWRYRGQVQRGVRQVRVVLEVTAREADAVVASGTLWADDLPIYRIDGLAVGWLDAPAQAPAGPALPEARPAAAPRPAPVAALLDTFSVQGQQGAGHLRLDPAHHPWLADHCPTLTAPALPLAFAAEIAAEAALLLRPGQRVIGLPTLEASRWLHAGNGPIDVLVAAVAEGDTVAVSLAQAGPSGAPVVHMRAVVVVGPAWPAAPPRPPKPEGLSPDPLSAAELYSGGHTFHGPTLHVLTDPGAYGPAGATATLQARPDADLLGRDGLAFVLDPALLDGATHPMRSATPHVWSSEIPAGKLAYPVRAEGLRFFGPRPVGPVTCQLQTVEASAKRLVFDVWLEGAAGPWCAYRWVEAVVDGGLLAAGAEIVRRALVAGEALPLPLGRATPEGWRIGRRELVEPLPGTLAALLLTPAERAALAATPEGVDLLAWLAAKQWVRAHLAAKGAPDLHLRRLSLLTLRPGVFIVQDCADLPAEAITRLLHPTRLVIGVQRDADGAEARRLPGLPS